MIPDVRGVPRVGKAASPGDVRRNERARAELKTTAVRAGTMVLLTRLARVVYLRSSVELLGLNLKHMVALAYLRDHPNVAQQSMTEDLWMDSNTGMFVLKELEERRLVERQRDPSDRRRHKVDVTVAGLETLERAEAVQETMAGEVLSGLSDSERKAFRRLLMKALEDPQLRPTLK